MPARAATTVILSAGVSVGAMTAIDWPKVSMRFSAPCRNFDAVAGVPSTVALIALGAPNDGIRVERDCSRFTELGA
jgi:hypothetical protein